MVLNEIDAKTGRRQLWCNCDCNGNAISVISVSDHIWVASAPGHNDTGQEGSEADLEIC